jgi:N-glycosylase/DNA lyase
MNTIIKKIKKLEKSSISKIINKRLKEFEKIKSCSNDKWFSELCFCILTANSKAKTAINIQNELGVNGFLKKSVKEITRIIKKNKHRFHNNKAKYIVEARKFSNIKTILTKIKNKNEKREWLVKNIKGIGYKESSHFLRNVGYFNYAILDRHILNLMVENKMLKEKSKTLTCKKYLEIEKKLELLSKKINFSQGKLDLYLWYMKTGEILK